MTNHNDIRWKQRFQSFKNALAQLAEGVEIATERDLSKLESQGLIKAFEFVYELSWNTIKDYYNYEGISDIQGPRDAFNHAIQNELVKNGEIWMKMIVSRNQASHGYDEQVANRILDKIINAYFAEFEQLKCRLEEEL